jgi:hypothetical protein
MHQPTVTGRFYSERRQDTLPMRSAPSRGGTGLLTSRPLRNRCPRLSLAAGERTGRSAGVLRCSGMKPGERVDLIKKLADELSTTTWQHVDLVLRQFKLPWSQEWHGPSDLDVYASSHLERGSDDQLLELEEYLFPEADAPRPAAVNRWKLGRFRLFMSHVQADKLLVSNVKNHLSRYGIDCFVAHEDIEPTKEWITEIENALDTCQPSQRF